MRVAFLAFFLGLFGCSRRDPDNIEVAIQGETVVLNGKSFSEPINIDSLVGAINRPARSFHGANNIYTFDDVGICVYHKRESDDVGTILFSFGPHEQKLDYWSKKTFKGKI